ncbi:MAG: T9SS type A sorting domain-containing protein [Calditrichaeota bacterium]|nr:T9SS type A sorting domain-containing protein [Calditrichota bacterium]
MVRSRNSFRLLVSLLALFFFGNLAFSQGRMPGPNFPSHFTLSIHPDENVELEVGDQVLLMATLRDSNHQIIQTVFEWSLSDTSIGVLDSTGLFTAMHEGSGYVKVSAPQFNLADSVFIQIKAGESSDDDGDHPHHKKHSASLRIKITPDEVEMAVGQKVTFQVEIVDSTNSPVTLPISWRVMGQPIGTVDDTGTFTATADGRGFVVASSGNLSVRSRIKVGDENSRHMRNHEKGKWQIKITPDEARLSIGDQVQFSASIYDSTGTPVDTTVTWKLDGWPIGTIDSTGLFTATALGAGVVRAYLDGHYGEAEIKVRNKHSEERWHHSRGNRDYSLSITPEDTLLHVGDTLRFVATYFDANGTPVDTLFTWKLRGQAVGVLDSTGNFIATQTGFALVRVRVGNHKADASVQVLSAASNPADVDTILVKTCLPNGFELPDSMAIREGSMIKFRGFPFPFNLLNGGLLTIPNGALHENITLTIYMPDFAAIDSNHVDFKEKILNAINFEVSVNNQAIHPYYFDKPLKLSLPYRPQLLDSLGMTIDDLGMFFYSGSDYDSSGVSNVVLDSTNHRIFADVYHFSTLVLSSGSVLTSTSQGGLNNRVPTQLELYQNYPNPFNPVTSISYALPMNSHVTVRVFNMLGQEIKTLINQKQTAGVHTIQWNGTDKYGMKVGSGIYFYQIQSDRLSIVKKMILMK